MRAVEQHVQIGQLQKTPCVLVLQRLHSDESSGDAERLACPAYEQSVGVFAEREADDRADQFHPRALHGPVVERVAEYHRVTRLLGDL